MNNYAVHIAKSRHLDSDNIDIDCFVVDCKRIVYSTSFRKLGYKTQVFFNHNGKLFRTRLTHTLEVKEVGSTLAKGLGVNHDLVSAICFAHDLGHTPFGHIGQSELNKCLVGSGHNCGFEHNIHSLRIVDFLERQYIDFPGLNLTNDTREGILKHCSIFQAEKLADIGKRFIDHTSPSLEAQIADLADEIAYNCHDIDDGLRAEILNLDSLLQFPILQEIANNIMSKYNVSTKDSIFVKELVRQLLVYSINDVISTTNQNIVDNQIESLKQVKNHGEYMVSFSNTTKVFYKELHKFLLKNLYHSEQVLKFSFKACKVIKGLFNAYMDDIDLLPVKLRKRFEGIDNYELVCDYIAGMTDSYAIEQYKSLFVF